MVAIVLRVLGGVAMLGGLGLLLGASLFFSVARDSAATAVRNPVYDYVKVRDMAALQAVPAGATAVIFGAIVDDAPATPFTVEGLNGQREERRLVLYRLYTYTQDGQQSTLREVKQPFVIKLEDGTLPLVNDDYSLGFDYFAWHTVEGPWVEGQVPGGQVTVVGTVTTVDGAPVFRATRVSDASPDAFTDFGGPTPADTASGFGAVLQFFGLIGLGGGLLLLLLAAMVNRKPRPTQP